MMDDWKCDPYFVCVCVFPVTSIFTFRKKKKKKKKNSFDVSVQASEL